MWNNPYPPAPKCIHMSFPWECFLCKKAKLSKFADPEDKMFTSPVNMTSAMSPDIKLTCEKLNKEALLISENVNGWVLVKAIVTLSGISKHPIEG